MSSKSEAICETIQKERKAGFVTSHCLCVHHAVAQNMTIIGASQFSLLLLRILLQIIFLVDVKS